MALVKIIIPKQKFGIDKDQPGKIWATNLRYQRVGLDPATNSPYKEEKGNSYEFSPKPREVLTEAMESEKEIEVDIGEPKAPGWPNPIKIPGASPQKAGGGGGGKGGYKGKVFTFDEYFTLFGKLKNRVNEANKKMYTDLPVEALAELTRSEVAQHLCMLRDNLFTP